MRSSTSSSDVTPSGPPARAGQQAACIAVTVCTVIALGFASELVMPAATRNADIVQHAPPPDDASYYLAHDRGGHVDHHVLYHGIDATVTAQLQAADVLFLGNSRMMFALDSALLRQTFRDLGLTYYVLGFGHEEYDDFPMQIIARNDLTPSWVVVNADAFFWDDVSDWAAETIADSAFDAWKLQVEAEASHAVRRRLHSLVPHFVDVRKGEREFVIYRSRADGSWFVATDFGEGTHFYWPPPDDQHLPAGRSLQAAESFKREVEARGGRLVLFLVPAPDASINRTRALADHLDVPLVIPHLTDVSTIDGSHLSVESSRRFSRLFLDELRHLLATGR